MKSLFKKSSDVCGDAITAAQQQVDLARKFAAKRVGCAADRDAATQGLADFMALDDSNMQAPSNCGALAAEYEALCRAWPVLVERSIEAIRAIPSVAADLERQTAQVKRSEADKIDGIAAPWLRKVGEVLEIPVDRRWTHFCPDGLWLNVFSLKPSDETDTIATMSVDPLNRRPFAIPKPARLRGEAQEHMTRADAFERLAKELVPLAKKKSVEVHEHAAHGTITSLFGAAQAGLTPPVPMDYADVQVSDLEELFRRAVVGVGRTIEAA